MLVFFLPLTFIQKCEDAYYLPKFILLAGAIQFMIPVLFNLKYLKLHLPDYVTFIFMFLITISAVLSAYKIQALMRWMEWFGVLAVFLYAKHFLRPKEIKRVVILIMVSSFLVALYALLQVMHFDMGGWITNFSGRSFSSLGNPDFLGGFLVLTVPMVVCFNQENGRNITSVFLFFFLSLTIFFSQTRSSIVAYTVILVLLLFLFWKYFKTNYGYILLGLLLSFIIIVVTGSGQSIIQRFTSASLAANVDLHGRFDMWQTGLKMFSHNFWTGTGLASIKNVYCQYAKAGPYLETDHLHNDFIEIAAESGVFVWLAFMTFLISVFYALIRKKETLAFIAIIAFTGMCVQAFFNFPFFVLDTKLYFFIIMGIALAEWQQLKVGRFQIAAIIGIALLTFVTSLRILAGSIYLNAGINNVISNNKPAAVYALEKAEQLYYDEKPLSYFVPLLNSLGRIKEADIYSKKYMLSATCAKNGYLQYSINMAEGKNYQEALISLDKFLVMSPVDKDVLSNKGKILYMAGNHKEALNIYRQLVVLYPKDETVHNNLYGIYFNAKMNKEAEKEKNRWEKK